MFSTPVLLIIFNRPDVTFQVFERIRQIKPGFLFIAADGPRADRPGEKELCEQSRSIIQQIDWPCEVKTLFRESNIGCGQGVSGAISWFFEYTDKGIILEDDCLPDPSFFSYCSELLEYYEKEKSVMHIGGNNSQFGKKRNKYSYYFSKYPHIWGWATWKRAWDKFQLDLSGVDIEKETDKIFSNYIFSEEEKKYWRDHFELMKRKGMDTWDIQWTFACWKNKGVTIVPNVNLISNLGFAENATHTQKSSVLANVPTNSIGQLVHPPQIEIDAKADEYTFTKYNLWQPSKIEQVKNAVSQLLPQGFKKAIKNILGK